MLFRRKRDVQVIDVFVRGDDWSLWHRWWDGTGWQPWERVGGFLRSGPDASSCSSGSLDVFARMSDGLWRKHYSGGGFGSWQHVQGDWSNGPGATCRPSTTNIDVMKVGTDKAVWWLELPS